MKTEPNDPINPVIEDDTISAYDDRLRMTCMSSGLTKREHFATVAMQGLCASPHATDNKAIVKIAVEIADLLIEELNK